MNMSLKGSISLPPLNQSISSAGLEVLSRIIYEIIFEYKGILHGGELQDPCPGFKILKREPKHLLE